MRRLAVAALMAASVLLAGCAETQSVIDWATHTATTPQEANTVDAAGQLFVGADHEADTFVKTGKCNRACRDELSKLSSSVRKDLDDAIDANTKGDSAKVKVALDLFNQTYPALIGFLAQKGAAQ